MFSLNDSPLAKIVNAIDQDRYSLEKSEAADGAEAYIITHDDSGVRIRVQAGGAPDPLSMCGEDTDADDWGELSADPAKAVVQIKDFANWLAARQDR